MTPQRARELFGYNPSTGWIIWRTKSRPASRVYIGQRAGTVVKKGYRRILVEGEQLPETHLIWLIVQGRLPIGEIDHINLIKDDNRWVNLRECNRTENMRNQNVHRNNTSGCKGVNTRENGKFRARIRVDKKLLYLGTFDTAAQAAAAYQAAAAKYFGAFAR